MMIELHKGDCLEILKQIPDGSVDMVLTDPPYGTTACKWDVVIPFEPMWEQLKRIIKPTGAIVLFGSEPFSSHLRLSNIKDYKYDWIWRKSKPTGFVHAKNKPLKEHEIVSIFSKGTTVHASQSSKRMSYNPLGLIEINATKTQKSKQKMGSLYQNRPSHKDAYIQKFTNYPTTVLSFKGEHGHHPTQKPVALLEYLIKTYTIEGETVLDFTMGSGSTGVACVNTGRKFIGIELDDHYFNVAEQRIKAVKNELAKVHDR